MKQRYKLLELTILGYLVMTQAFVDFLCSLFFFLLIKLLL